MNVRNLAGAVALVLCAGGAHAAPPNVSAASWVNPLVNAQLDRRVVLLDFWAAWCVPCVRNLPTMQSYADAFKDQPFTLIGVHYSEAPHVEMYLRDQNIQFPVAIDTGETFKRFGVVMIPTYVLIDKQGNVRSTGNEPPAKERIAELIAESSYSMTLSEESSDDLPHRRFEIVVKDDAGNIVMHPQVGTEGEASITDTKGDRTFVIRLTPHSDGSAEAMLDVTECGKIIQRSTVIKSAMRSSTE